MQAQTLKQAQTKFYTILAKIKYIFSTLSVCSNPCIGPLPTLSICSNPCIGPLPKIKISFFLLSIFVDELISTPKIIKFLPVPPLRYK